MSYEKIHAASSKNRMLSVTMKGDTVDEDADGDDWSSCAMATDDADFYEKVQLNEHVTVDEDDAIFENSYANGTCKQDDAVTIPMVPIVQGESVLQSVRWTTLLTLT